MSTLYYTSDTTNIVAVFSKGNGQRWHTSTGWQAHVDGNWASYKATFSRIGTSQDVIATGPDDFDTVAIYATSASDVDDFPLDVLDRLSPASIRDDLDTNSTKLAAILADTDSLDTTKITTARANDLDDIVNIYTDTQSLESKITTARAQVLSDWIDAGRLDALLDAVQSVVNTINGKLPANTSTQIALIEAMRGTDNALLASGYTAPPSTSAINSAIEAGAVGTNAAAAKAVTDKIDTALEADGATGYQFTTLALENAPDSASDATAANQTTIINHLTDIKGGTFSGATDSLEAIRNQGDSAWLTATGFSTLDAAGVRTAVGLASANLDTQLAAIDTDTADIAAIKAVTDKIDTALEADGAAGYQFTTLALENAPSGGGGDATLANQTTIITHLTDMKGATFAGATDSLEAIRNQGDIAWLTASATGIRAAVGLASANLDTQLAAIDAVTDKLDTTLEVDGASGYQFTTLALENGPAGGGGGTATLANQTTIINHLTDIKGGTFSGATDSLEAIRNQGDSAWITATGFSTLDAAGVRTAVGLASANLDTQLTTIDSVVDAAKAVTDKLDTALEVDGAAGYQFTTLALENAPTGGGGGGDATLANQTTIITHLTDIKGATFAGATDSLEAIRNQGDSAWLTATGFSTLDAAGVRTAVGLASANLDTQLSGIAALDATAANQSAILAAVAALNDLDAAGVRTAIGLASANMDTQLGNILTAASSAAGSPASMEIRAPDSAVIPLSGSELFRLVFILTDENGALADPVAQTVVTTAQAVDSSALPAGIPATATRIEQGIYKLEFSLPSTHPSQARFSILAEAVIGALAVKNYHFIQCVRSQPVSITVNPEP